MPFPIAEYTQPGARDGDGSELEETSSHPVVGPTSVTLPQERARVGILKEKTISELVWAAARAEWRVPAPRWRGRRRWRAGGGRRHGLGGGRRRRTRRQRRRRRERNERKHGLPGSRVYWRRIFFFF